MPYDIHKKDYSNIKGDTLTLEEREEPVQEHNTHKVWITNHGTWVVLGCADIEGSDVESVTFTKQALKDFLVKALKEL